MPTLPILEKIRAALAGRTPGEWYWHNRVFESSESSEVIGYDRLQAFDEVERENDVVAWRKTAWLAVKPADATIIENAPEWLESLLPVVEAAVNYVNDSYTYNTLMDIRLEKAVKKLLESNQKGTT